MHPSKASIAEATNRSEVVPPSDPVVEPASPPSAPASSPVGTTGREGIAHPGEAVPGEPVEAVEADGVLTLTLNRPAVLNAIDPGMAQLLEAHLKRASADASIRVVVLTGKGRAFCAGGDLKFALEANPEQPGDAFFALTAVLHACIELICRMPKPVVAAINGPAAGAGLFLALACDLRLMAQSAYLKVSNPSYGLSLPAGGTFLLPRLAGLGRALEMIMLDSPISALEAEGMGLVTSVAADEAFPEEAQLLARRLTNKAIHTLGQVKQLLYGSLAHTLPEQLLLEQQAIAQSANHAEGREGLAAFVEKRKPVFLPKVQVTRSPR